MCTECGWGWGVWIVVWVPWQRPQWASLGSHMKCYGKRSHAYDGFFGNVSIHLMSNKHFKQWMGRLAGANNASFNQWGLWKVTGYDGGFWMSRQAGVGYVHWGRGTKEGKGAEGKTGVVVEDGRKGRGQVRVNGDAAQFVIRGLKSPKIPPAGRYNVLSKYYPHNQHYVTFPNQLLRSFLNIHQPEPP